MGILRPKSRKYSKLACKIVKKFHEHQKPAKLCESAINILEKLDAFLLTLVIGNNNNRAGEEEEEEMR